MWNTSFLLFKWTSQKNSTRTNKSRTRSSSNLVFLQNGNDVRRQALKKKVYLQHQVKKGEKAKQANPKGKEKQNDNKRSFAYQNERTGIF